MVRLRSRRRAPGGATVVAAGGGRRWRLPDAVVEPVEAMWVRIQVHEQPQPASIAVTSFLSGEGVSTVSRALAVRAAKAGPTCLVETNWWSPDAGVDDAARGWLELLDGEPLERLVVDTDVPGLQLVPAGTPADLERLEPSDPELVADVIDLLTERFDAVILDLPALTVSPLAAVGARAADGSILVVHQGVTDIEQVEAARAELRGGNLLGAVLNASRIATPGRARRWGGER